MIELQRYIRGSGRRPMQKLDWSGSRAYLLNKARKRHNIACFESDRLTLHKHMYSSQRHKRHKRRQIWLELEHKSHRKRERQLLSWVQATSHYPGWTTGQDILWKGSQMSSHNEARLLFSCRSSTSEFDIASNACGCTLRFSRCVYYTLGNFWLHRV